MKLRHLPLAPNTFPELNTSVYSNELYELRMSSYDSFAGLKVVRECYYLVLDHFR